MMRRPPEPGDASATSFFPPQRASQARLPGALRRLPAGLRVVLRPAALDAPPLHLRLLDGDEDFAGGHPHRALLGLPLQRPAALDGDQRGGDAGSDGHHRQLQPGQEAALPLGAAGAGGGARGAGARGHRRGHFPRRAGDSAGADVRGAAGAAGGGAATDCPDFGAGADPQLAERLLPRHGADPGNGLHRLVLSDADRLPAGAGAGAVPVLAPPQSPDAAGGTLPAGAARREAGMGAGDRRPDRGGDHATLPRPPALQAPEDLLRGRNLRLVQFLLGAVRLRMLEKGAFGMKWTRNLAARLTIRAFALGAALLLISGLLSRAEAAPAAAKPKTKSATPAATPAPVPAADEGPGFGPQPPDGKWLKDKEGRQYFLEKLEKEGPFLRLNDHQIRTRWGITVDVVKEDEKFFYYKVYKSTGSFNTMRPKPTQEEVEKMVASYAVNTPEAHRLSFTSFGQGLPTSGQWRNGFDLADITGDGF